MSAPRPFDALNGYAATVELRERIATLTVQRDTLLEACTFASTVLRKLTDSRRARSFSDAALLRDVDGIAEHLEAAIAQAKVR